MRHQVVDKQQISKHCFVCGIENSYGLKAEFFALENKELVAIFTPQENHQSYPGRTHGGVSAAILDETIGRAIMNLEPGIWGVTVELELRYKKPVPIGQSLRVVGRITQNNRRLFCGEGEILLENGEVAVTASGRYMKLPIEKIAQGDFDLNEEMFSLERDEDPKDIELASCWDSGDEF